MDFGAVALFEGTKLTTERVFEKTEGYIVLYHNGNFLLKVSEDGKLEKVHHLSKYKCEYSAIATDDAGNIYLGGYYKGNNTEQLREDGKPSQPALEIGNKTLPGSKYASDIMQEASFVAKLDKDWNTDWTYTLSSERENRVESLTVVNGQIAASGFWKMNLNDGNSTFKSTENASPYKSEAYQQLFDLNGKRLATVVYQGKGSEWPNHALNASNQIVTFGCFREEMNIGSSHFTSKGMYQNAFILFPKTTSISTSTEE